jgi:H+/Na+-translocating ferredoxin:NAD+ oxidoreductase subunit E
MSTNYRDIIETGIWTQNPSLLQLLGLWPTPAISNTLVNGFGLGLATARLMAGSSGAVAAGDGA